MRKAIKLQYPGIVFTLLYFAIVFPAHSLRGEDWPSITPAEMALKDDPINPGAPAIILYRGVHTDDNQGMDWVLLRYKIFKEEGRKYADVEIPYFPKFGTIEDIRARTVHPDGREVQFSGQIFDKLLVKAKKLSYQAKTFTLPDVHPGSIIEYSYKVKSRGSLPDELKNPQDYAFKYAYCYPTAHWRIEQSLSMRQARFSLLPLRGAELNWLWLRLPPGKSPAKSSDGAVVLDLQLVPAFQEEDYMPPEGISKGRVDLYYYAGFTGNPERFWNDYATLRAEEIDKFIGQRKAIAREVAAIVNPSDPPDSKLRKLYARTQRIRALSYERNRSDREEDTENLKANENVEDILKHGYARANELNFFFVALARAAGFDSGIVDLTSRDQNYFIRQLPDPSQLNAMVAWVRVGDQDRYFDPATLYCPFDLLPWGEAEGQGLRPTPRGAVMVTTPKPASRDAVIERIAALEMDSQGAIQGKVEIMYIGHEALQRRLENRNSDAAGRRKALEDEIKSWLPASATVELLNQPAWEQSDMKLAAELKVSIPEFGASTGKRLLLPLGIFQVTGKHPFPNAKRVHPIYFGRPYQRLDEITLKVPEGYRVESSPPPRKKEFPFCRYEISHPTEDGVVRQKRQLIMDGYFLRTESYSALRVFYDSVRAGDEEQIVLKAVEPEPPK